MTPEERRALEQRAERSTRRGELADAHAALQTLVEHFPGEPALAQKLAELQGALQPSELLNPKARAPVERPAGNSLADQAEAAAAAGNYARAIQIYRQLIAQKPDADLLKERLAEIFQHAQASMAKSAPAALDRASALEQMLERIGSRRRK